MLIVRHGFWRSTIRRLPAGLLAILLATAILPLCEASARAANLEPLPASSKHILLISVKGMGSHFYVPPSADSRIASLRRLMQEGSYAESVVGVYPSVSYPSHAAIVMGHLPAKHGIYSNLSSREPGKKLDDWFLFSKALNVPTLLRETRQAHLTSAAVSWPVTVGAGDDSDADRVRLAA